MKNRYQQTIKIVYACNDAYFDGLYLSILSIVRRTKTPIQFYLLSADCAYLKPSYKILSKKHQKILIDLVKKYNKKNSFTLIDCKKEYERFIKGGKNEKTKFSPYTTFRLLLKQFPVFTGKVLYIDIDTMACDDVAKLYKQDVKNYDFGVVIDRLGHVWHGKTCFNAGIMLFNMDRIRRNDFIDKSLHYLKTRKLHFCDQSAMRLAKPHFIYLPRKFNEQGDIRKDTVIKHFCARFKGWPKYHNIKQWHLNQIHRIKNIDVFKEDFKIFKRESKKWNKK